MTKKRPDVLSHRALFIEQRLLSLFLLYLRNYSASLSKSLLNDSVLFPDLCESGYSLVEVMSVMGSG